MTIDDSILLYLNNRIKNTDKESVDLIKSIAKLKVYSRGEIILDYGEFNDSTFILKSGFTANFSQLEDGSNFIRTIFKPNDEFGSLRCSIKKEKSNVVFKALTDCEVLELESMELLNQRHPFITNLYISILENTFLKFEKRIAELAGLDASKRYIMLRQEISNIDNILPQYQIANYLNITPVQLSRIRKKIFSN